MYNVCVNYIGYTLVEVDHAKTRTSRIFVRLTWVYNIERKTCLGGGGDSGCTPASVSIVDEKLH